MFFNDTATTEISTLSLHDALPNCPGASLGPTEKLARQLNVDPDAVERAVQFADGGKVVILGRIEGKTRREDRKSTRLNSSHANISYAVLCLKKTNQSTQVVTRACI